MTRKPLLPTLLWLDALTCLLMGTVLIAGAGPLSTLTALPAPLLFWAGLALLPIAAFMAWVGHRAADWGPAVVLILIGNAAWVLASLALAFGPWVQPNGLGLGVLLLQALAVTGIALLEIGAWRRQPQGLMAHAA